MGILSRTVFAEIASSATLGMLLFTFVLFLRGTGKLFEQLVRSAANAETVGYLFLLILPPTMPFTVPVGVLVGILIALGRMSSDAEVIALRAAGVPAHRLLWPVATFGVLGMMVAAAASCWLTPWANRETYRVVNKLVAEQLTADVQPRVFEEQFPNKVLYVKDVITGTVSQWRKIFIADITPVDQRKKGSRETSDGPTVTVAAEALAIPDIANNRIQLSMKAGRSYEVGKNPEDYYATDFPKGDQVLEAQKPNEVKAKAYVDMDMGPLYREIRASREAAIEFHQRLALPVACVILAIVALPLGISSRKGGKSAAFVLTVSTAFLYYMGLITMLNLARQGALEPWIAVWTPNTVFFLLGVVTVSRLEAPGDRDPVGAVRDWFLRVLQAFGRRVPGGGGTVRTGTRIPLLPQIIDGYILSSFLYYFFMLLFTMVMMTEIFTFFELLSDIIKNKIPMARVGTYLFFLTPKLIYDVTPISVLVAVLVCFGILAKNNEITAMKACGISLYRLSMPVLLASMVLSGLLFAFDHYIVPDANVKQDAIRNEIKGRPVQTFLRPDRKWIFGHGPWIYYYKYFDPVENVMVGPIVHELDEQDFQLRRHIFAEKARWEPLSRRWVFQNGWRRDLRGVRITEFQDFDGGTATFPELDDPPNYFLMEVRQEKQMNFQQLDSYIRELQQSGLDTVKLRVQYHKKFSVPLFAFIMALLSIPFAFIAGNRGAMAGVGISLVIAIAYWALGQLSEQMGNLGQLPPAMSAWSPDAIFLLAGLYFMMRMRT